MKQLRTKALLLALTFILAFAIFYIIPYGPVFYYSFATQTKPVQFEGFENFAAGTYIAGELEFNVHSTDEERASCAAFAMHDGNLYSVEAKEYSLLTAILDELGKGTLQ